MLLDLAVGPLADSLGQVAARHQAVMDVVLDLLPQLQNARKNRGEAQAAVLFMRLLLTGLMDRHTTGFLDAKHQLLFLLEILHEHFPSLVASAEPADRNILSEVRSNFRLFSRLHFWLMLSESSVATGSCRAEGCGSAGDRSQVPRESSGYRRRARSHLARLATSHVTSFCPPPPLHFCVLTFRCYHLVGFVISLSVQSFTDLSKWRGSFKRGEGSRLFAGGFARGALWEHGRVPAARLSSCPRAPGSTIRELCRGGSQASPRTRQGIHHHQHSSASL